MPTSNALLNPLKKVPSGPRIGFGGFSIIAHSAGVSDSALKADSSTEMAMVSANCLYMLPTSPPSMATGTNTADRISAMPITGAETSFIAWIVASLGASPFSM